jgi:hypothetical protein
MYRNPFDGARAKIERSHRHFRELVTLQNSFNEVQPLVLDLQPQANGDTKVFAKIAELPPLEHSAIVSDIIGAFRSSLDIAVSQACRVRGQENKKLLDKTYFAFAGDERDWELNVDRRMAGADATIRATVRSFRPWAENGNVMLYALSKLTAHDKHVDLVPVGAGAGELAIDGLKLTRGDGLGNGVQMKSPVWGDATSVELMTVISPSKVEIAGPCVLRASIGFRWDAYGVAGRPVVPTLNEMGAMCEKIIDIIEAAARLP